MVWNDAKDPYRLSRQQKLRLVQRGRLSAEPEFQVISEPSRGNPST